MKFYMLLLITTIFKFNRPEGRPEKQCQQPTPEQIFKTSNHNYVPTKEKTM